jgi:uncharacterized membrane protein
MKYENSVTIDRPVQEVFEYITNLENSPTWQSVVLEAHETSSGPTGVGSTGAITGKFLGRRIDLTTEITEWNPPNSFAARSTGGPFPLELRYTFGPQDGATQLTTVTDVEPGGFFRLAGPALEPLMKRQAQHDLETLKTVLESGTGASSL